GGAAAPLIRERRGGGSPRAKLGRQGLPHATSSLDRDGIADGEGTGPDAVGKALGVLASRVSRAGHEHAASDVRVQVVRRRRIARAVGSGNADTFAIPAILHWRRSRGELRRNDRQ